jgi:transposase-like protein
VPYKKVVLEYADLCGRDVKSYREFGVSKSTFYEWRKAFRENDAAGLIPKKPVALHHPWALSPEAVQKILGLRKLLPRSTALCWCLARYYGINTSCASVYRPSFARAQAIATECRSGNQACL